MITAKAPANICTEPLEAPAPKNSTDNIAGNVPAILPIKNGKIGILSAPRYILTTSNGRILIMRKKKETNKAFLSSSLCNTCIFGYFCSKEASISSPEARPTQYGIRKHMSMPTTFTMIATNGSNRYPATACKTMTGNTTVRLLPAYKSHKMTIATRGSAGIKETMFSGVNEPSANKNAQIPIAIHANGRNRINFFIDFFSIQIL